MFLCCIYIFILLLLLLLFYIYFLLFLLFCNVVSCGLCGPKRYDNLFCFVAFITHIIAVAVVLGRFLIFSLLLFLLHFIHKCFLIVFHCSRLSNCSILKQHFVLLLDANACAYACYTLIKIDISLLICQ